MLGPSQSLTFMEFIVDSLGMPLSLPVEKVRDIQHWCQDMPTVRHLAQVLGEKTATMTAILLAPLQLTK